MRLPSSKPPASDAEACEATATGQGATPGTAGGDAPGETEATATGVGSRPRTRRSTAEEALPPGANLGRYVVLGVIGSGGMGVVYRAYDPDLDRAVAVKVMRARYGSEDGQARLLREAQALAKLAHPSVVAVHDVGIIDEQVFVAMELVEGTTLRDWVKQQARTWRQIVSVMVDAGRGLAAAHDAGLVHRDIKPTNLLIDRAGRVRIVDFGLARPAGHAAPGEDPEQPEATAAEPPPVEDPSESSPSGAGSQTSDRRASLLSAELTAAGQWAGTAAYAPPEQRQGIISAQADQYAYCVTFFEVLYGRRPPPGRRPLRPERAEAPLWLHRILERGLSLDPDARYPSMRALLDAIDRDLRAPARRAWIAAAGAGGAAVLVAGALVFGVAKRASEPPCAGSAARLTGVWDDSVRQSVSRAFAATGVAHAADTSVLVSAALDDWAARWVAQRTDACEATQVRGDQSETLMDLRMQCLERRRQHSRALTDLFARADRDVVDKAVVAVRELPPLESCSDVEALTAAVPLPAAPEARARLEAAQGTLASAQALQAAGKYAEAEAVVAPLLDDARALDFAPLTAEVLHAAGMLAEENGDNARAESLLYRAGEAAAVAREDVLAGKIWIDVLWIVGYKQNRHELALGLQHTARAAVARAGAPPVLVSLLEDRLGALEYARGNFAEALAHYERSMVATEEAGSGGRNLASLLNNMGEANRQLGRLEEAQRLYERALAAKEAEVGAAHPAIARLLNNLGIVLESRRQYEQAGAMFERALAIREAALGPDHPDLGHSLLGLASIYAQQKRYDQAMALQERVLDLWRKSFGAQHAYVAYPLLNIGSVLREQARCLEAVPPLLEALAIFEGALGATHPMIGHPLTVLGACKVDLDRAAEAVPLLERALRVRTAGEGPDAELAETRYQLARALTGVNRDRRRAATLAREAREGFARAGQDDRVAEVDRWLDGGAGARD